MSALQELIKEHNLIELKIRRKKARYRALTSRMEKLREAPSAPSDLKDVYEYILETLPKVGKEIAELRKELRLVNKRGRDLLLMDYLSSIGDPLSFL